MRQWLRSDCLAGYRGMVWAAHRRTFVVPRHPSRERRSDHAPVDRTRPVDSPRPHAAAPKPFHGDANVWAGVRPTPPNAYDARTSTSRRALDFAAHGLARRTPGFSARTPAYRWQLVFFPGAVCVAAASALAAPVPGALAISVVMSVAFLSIIAVRLAALLHHVRASFRGHRACRPPADPDVWPRYGVLVPVYKESLVVPGLVEAMAALRYPRDRLEIIFITEECDVATRLALLTQPLEPCMRVVTVPDGEPRTKPRALNFALADCATDLIAIYDAEDAPDCDQLLKAARCFAGRSGRLACLQAALVIDDATNRYFQRHFAFEYATLFQAVLPMLAKHALPIPLGGTSNHFRRDALVAAGGWDAFNVTEDADLGFRLVRLGYEIDVLPSKTVEEAPACWADWLKQRSRWLKGWMVTYLVHTRQPAVLTGQLGAFRALVFHALLGGMILSAIAHPWLYLVAGANLVNHGALVPELPSTPGEQAVWWLAIATVSIGYLTSVVFTWTVARATCRRWRPWRDAMLVLLIPIYWLAISAAAYVALIELVRRPFHWMKTPHRPRPVTKPVTKQHVQL